MKITSGILSLVCVIAVAIAAAMYLSATGSNRLLTTMQEIRPGSTQQDVREIMGREPQIAPADQSPFWIEDVTRNDQDGEYWYYFMGYPSRNLIIYFDENGRVVYTTWAWT